MCTPRTCVSVAPSLAALAPPLLKALPAPGSLEVACDNRAPTSGPRAGRLLRQGAPVSEARAAAKGEVPVRFWGTANRSKFPSLEKLQRVPSGSQRGVEPAGWGPVAWVPASHARSAADPDSRGPVFLAGTTPTLVSLRFLEEEEEP